MNKSFKKKTSPSPAPSGSGEAEAPCSLYMKELQSFIARCRTDYLNAFSCHDFVMDRSGEVYILFD